MHFLEKNDPCFNSNEERNIILKTILDHKILSKEIKKKRRKHIQLGMKDINERQEAYPYRR